MRLNRRQVLAQIGLGGAAVMTRNAFAGGELAPKGSPNVLIFMPDQQNGATVLPGSPVHKPNLDRFMQEAVTFDSAHCPAPHCCPSRASFMTGLYPSEHGVFNNVTTPTAIHANPNPGTHYWGTTLRDAGYQMGYAGKLHVGRNVRPEDCGFKNLNPLEQDSIEAAIGRDERGWKRAREEKSDPAARRPGEYLRPGWGNEVLYRTVPDAWFEQSPDYKVVQTGIAGIKAMAAGGSPWCVMVSNNGSHDAYVAPKRFVDLYDLDKVPVPPSFSDTLIDKPRVYQRQRYQTWDQLSERETRDAIRHYWAQCSMQDELFGQLLKALDETGQAQNTIVLYVSDHGDYAGAHGLWMKGVPAFEEAYHIPFVLRWPKGMTSKGRRVGEFVDQVDFASTVLDACGLKPPSTLSGKSLLPFLRSETPADWRKEWCTQMNGVELYYTQRAVTTKEWKYVYNGFDFDEFYNLKADPHEMKNLAFPDVAAAAAGIGKGLARDGSVPWPPLPAILETVRKDMLKRLWEFGAAHQDTDVNAYGTVALAPYGPGLSGTFPRQPY